MTPVVPGELIRFNGIIGRSRGPCLILFSEMILTDSVGFVRYSVTILTALGMLNSGILSEGLEGLYWERI